MHRRAEETQASTQRYPARSEIEALKAVYLSCQSHPPPETGTHLSPACLSSTSKSLQTPSNHSSINTCLPPALSFPSLKSTHPSSISSHPSSKATHTQKTQQRPGATPSVTRKCNLLSSPRRFHPLAHQQAGPEAVGNGQHVGFFFQKKKCRVLLQSQRSRAGSFCVVMAALSQVTACCGQTDMQVGANFTGRFHFGAGRHVQITIWLWASQGSMMGCAGAIRSVAKVPDGRICSVVRA
jgi:hypothetical protein